LSSQNWGCERAVCTFAPGRERRFFVSTDDRFAQEMGDDGASSCLEKRRNHCAVGRGKIVITGKFQLPLRAKSYQSAQGVAKTLYYIKRGGGPPTC